MDHRLRTIRNIAELEETRASVLEAVALTSRWLSSFEYQPMSLFRAMRFTKIGHDPLTLKPLNIVEQLNQTFTILATLKAIELLFQLHSEVQGFRMALGTCRGRDIESIDEGLIAAEVFCATHPTSNQKLKKDIEGMSTVKADHRYVFFASPSHSGGRLERLETCDGVHVYAINL
jgi:hypothetical protein